MKRDFVSVGYGNGKEEILKRAMPGTEVKDVCGMGMGMGMGTWLPHTISQTTRKCSPTNVRRWAPRVWQQSSDRDVGSLRAYLG